MLNWDDPLVAVKPHDDRQPSIPPDSLFAEGRLDDMDADGLFTRSPEIRDRHLSVRPGQGLVGNRALMVTAGAAPVVAPDPFVFAPTPQTELPIDDMLIPPAPRQTQTPDQDHSGNCLRWCNRARKPGDGCRTGAGG